MRRIVALLAVLAACSSSESTSTPNAQPPQATGPADASTGCGLVIPAEYESANFATHAAIELGIRSQLTAFMQPMKDAEASLAATPSAATLRAGFDAAASPAPSLRAITTPYFAGRVDAWLDAFSAAAGKSWTPAEPPVGSGGKFESYIYTERGTDIRQSIEKGLFGAMLYNHALTILRSPLTAASVDRLIAIYGAHPSFPRNDKAATQDGGAPFPDVLVALYAKRRDAGQTSAPGSYLRMKQAFITMKAAIDRGSACDAERDGAVALFKREWERVLFSTAVFYLNDVITKLSAASPTSADMANALHGFSEAAAFMHGFRGLPQDGRVATDAQIDGVLDTLGANPAGTVQTYKLAVDPSAELPKVLQAIQQIATIEGFSAQEMAAFKVNN